MTDKTSEIFNQLTNQILRRYRKSKGKSMLDVYQVDSDFLQVDNEFLEYLLTNREGIIAVFSDPTRRACLVELFVEEALRYTYENNQFIHLDEKEKGIFTGIYQDYIQGIQEAIETSPDVDSLEKALSGLISNHFHRLRTNIARFFDPQVTHSIHENLILKKAVCSDYSAEFQLKLMGIDLETLRTPVLDIGCGQEGLLVEYLQSKGLDARGADRVVDDENRLMSSDWFDLPLLPESWGTILSHMAFSNHFNFHHRYKNGQPERYARQYLKILRALQPGGCFIYSPGLPFIERFLPADQYRVKRSRLRLAQKDELHAVNSLKEDFWYVARVLRL
ncbi:MAG: class I SAM-dependent methyltransferase [Anaerolineaceae bacterium]